VCYGEGNTVFSMPCHDLAIFFILRREFMKKVPGNRQMFPLMIMRDDTFVKNGENMRTKQKKPETGD